MKMRKKDKELLIQDVLDRHQRTWPEEAATRGREKAEATLKKYLARFLKKLQGMQLFGLLLGLGKEHFKNLTFPNFQIPRIAGSEGRQHLAWLLHQKLKRRIRYVRVPGN